LAHFDPQRLLALPASSGMAAFFLSIENLPRAAAAAAPVSQRDVVASLNRTYQSPIP